MCFGSKYRILHLEENHVTSGKDQSALGREVPGNEMKSLEYNLRRTADDLRLRKFPVVAVHKFYIYFVCVLSQK